MTMATALARAFLAGALAAGAATAVAASATAARIGSRARRMPSHSMVPQYPREAGPFRPILQRRPEGVRMTEAIEALLSETRRFPPPAEFAARARISSPEIYAEAEADPAGFWKARALEESTWFEEPAEGLDDSNPPFYKWFADGDLNVSFNCLDRHLEAGGGDKTAYIWVGEPRRRAHDHLPAAARRRQPLRERAQGPRACSAAIASRSTSAWCRSCPSRCSPARASARRTRSSSAASRRPRSPAASTTPSARC